VAQDEDLLVTLGTLQQLPMLTVPLTLGDRDPCGFPLEDAEEIVDSAPVLMYPFAPVSSPLYLERFVPGVLVLTNFRLVFLVKGPATPPRDPTDVDADEAVGNTSASEPLEGTVLDPTAVSRASVDSSFVDVGRLSMMSSGSDGDSDSEAHGGLYGEDTVIPPAVVRSPTAPQTAVTNDLEVAYVDDGHASPAEALGGFQMSLGSLTGALKYERASGITACGSLEGLSSTGSSGSTPLDCFQGRVVLQVDCDDFKSPLFVLESRDGAPTNQWLQCCRFYDFLGHTVINRHNELPRLQMYVCRRTTLL
jgi:hypothetical protein